MSDAIADAAAEAIRRCGGKAGEEVAVQISDPALDQAVRGALETAGMLATTETAAFGIADGRKEDYPLVPDAVGVLLERLSPEGRLAMILAAQASDREPLDEAWLGRVLHTRHPVSTRIGAFWVVSGARRGVPSGHRRKELRRMGHGIEPSVLLGREGLTRKVLTALQDALGRHGLVKLKLTPQCEIDKREAGSIAARATGSVLVQRVGRTALLFLQGVPCDPPVPRKGRKRGQGG
jgi:RNA-binding protein